MDFFPINFELPPEVRSEILDFYNKANESEFYLHKSTGSGTYTHLDFLEYENDFIKEHFQGYERSTLLRIKANSTVTPHIDNYPGRNAVVIFPLSPYGDDYATAHSQGERLPFWPCYGFNTQSMHAVYNNNHDRISLQLEYSEGINELKKRFENFNK